LNSHIFHNYEKNCLEDVLAWLAFLEIRNSAQISDNFFGFLVGRIEPRSVMSSLLVLISGLLKSGNLASQN
jgi:hypothetical protein